MSILLYSMAILLMIMCVFLILLILIQKGRGGGLASAFGGAGGNTAFGSKTGDVLTWATSIVFGIFLVLAVVTNLTANAVNAQRVALPGATPAAAPPSNTPLSNTPPSNTPAASELPPPPTTPEATPPASQPSH
jgi:preprotein translocase subunit SecG